MTQWNSGSIHMEPRPCRKLTEQYAVLEGAVANFREIQRLLTVWEQETVNVVLQKSKIK